MARINRALSAAALMTCLCMAPVRAFAASENDPLNYPLKQYGFVLVVALLGGLVSWYSKVRSGAQQMFNLMALVGELTTSAFAGLLAFWICQYMGVSAPLEAALVGIAGHMGTRAINTFEEFAQRKWGAKEGE